LIKRKILLLEAGFLAQVFKLPKSSQNNHLMNRLEIDKILFIQMAAVDKKQRVDAIRPMSATAAKQTLKARNRMKYNE
jgi:hypothetical protein